MNIAIIIPSKQLPCWIKKISLSLQKQYPSASISYVLNEQSAIGYKQFSIPNYFIYNTLDKKLLAFPNSPFQIKETVTVESELESFHLAINCSFQPFTELDCRQIAISFSPNSASKEMIQPLHHAFLNDQDVTTVYLHDSASKQVYQFIAGVNELSIARTLHSILHRIHVDIIQLLQNKTVFYYPVQTNKRKRLHQLSLLKRLFKGFLKRKFGKSRWEILLKNLTTNERLTIQSTSTHFYADPFLIDEEQKTYLFLEKMDYATNKAHLVVRDSSDQFTTEEEILKLPYHLSYPQVFRHHSKYFLLPESSENNTLTLYEAKDFPTSWHSVGNLLVDVAIVDATIINHNDMYYLFATRKFEKDISEYSQLQIYYSEAFPSTKWQLHPFNNFVDPRYTRQAGQFYMKNNQLIRVCQDNAKSYGKQLHFFTVDELSPEQYKESYLKTIEPKQINEQYSGVHTFNKSERYSVIDALKI